MANVKTVPRPTRIQREQLCEAVMQGYLDSVLVSGLATAVSLGYVAGKITDVQT